MANGTWTEWTTKKETEFFETLAQTGNVTRACAACNVSRSGAYARRDNDDHFCVLWNDAMEIATDLLEEEARRRALNGREEPLSYQGRLTGDFIMRYSDLLLIFLLKGSRPEKYRDNSTHEIIGKDGKPIEINTARSEVNSVLDRIATAIEKTSDTQEPE